MSQPVDREQIRRDAEQWAGSTIQTTQRNLARHCLALLAEFEQVEQKFRHEVRDRNWWAANNSRERQKTQAVLAKVQAELEQAEEDLASTKQLLDQRWKEWEAAKVDITAADLGRDRAEAHLAKVPPFIEALQYAKLALHRHSEWCGYRRDAPGDSSFNQARDAIDAALAAWENE